MSGVSVFDTVTAPISAEGMSSSLTWRESGSGAAAVWPLRVTLSRFGATTLTDS
jgi:hypothetical protein